MSAGVSGSQQFRAEHFTSTLFKRVIRPARAPYGGFTQVFVVVDGKAEMAYGSEENAMPRHSVFSFPSACDPTLTLAPGTEAYLIGVSPELLIDVIGNNAESVLLRIFTERPALVTAGVTNAGLNSEFVSLVRGFLNEARLPGRGSQMAVAAYMRLILMVLWRTDDWDAPVTTGHGLDIAMLQRFRQLVELHFRERRPVRFYAAQLGVSHDRLHAICTRTLSRTPKELLQQRTAQEANLRLEKSGSPIQEIALQLGFPDQTYFSHFYKKATGQSPYQYRRQSLSKERPESESLHAEYADWP